MPQRHLTERPRRGPADPRAAGASPIPRQGGALARREGPAASGIVERPASATSEQTSQEAPGLYIISVAARMLEMHPQTLRKYERFGLVSPARTGGMLRLYSERDIQRLRLIKHWVDELGMNLAGVEFALGVFNQIAETHDRLAGLEMERRLDHLAAQMLQELRGLLGSLLPGPMEP
ncbi:MAG: MerR family transcriptional regulator [Chloroflexi bacterium]|nr:MerR family transcriptional regulator [Chloroflexota bacterium]